MLSGYSYSFDKLGYNGINEFGPAEVKPVNITSEKRKLNGGDNFTDLTYRRFNKYKKDKLTMLISGFIDGNLIYIIKLPFNCRNFVRYLRERLDRYYEEGKDKKGVYLRSVSFNYKNYEDCSNLEIVFLNDDLDKYKDRLTINFYSFL
ncbi:MAG: hypothetical protein ACUVWP_06965 [bacterium]